MTQITKGHLKFVAEAKNEFDYDSQLETYMNFEEPFIALRMGADRDCITLYEVLDDIANFTQQMDPSPNPRKSVMNFAHDMEKQLKVNDDKGGWNKEHWCDLAARLDYNASKIRKELMKPVEERDFYEITIRCTNVANYAMMISGNEGGPL
ncbi:hypothetical protein [Virgibacillus phage Mimir87]|nr:hypothetical protein [Virgibacillus phage Mimir87]